MSEAVYRVRRERGFLDAGWLQARFSFSFGGYRHPQGDRFGPVLALNEDLVQPAAGFPMHPHANLEIFMIPLSGSIAHADSLGTRCTVRTGEALMMRAGRGIRHSQFNASDVVADHHLQLWIEPDRVDLPPRVELRAMEEIAGGRWQVLAAPEGQGASFTLAQQARLLRGAACPTAPLELQLPPGHAAWLHVVSGRARAALSGQQAERLEAGEALEIASACGPVRLDALETQRVDVLCVVFPATLLLR